MTFEDWMIKRGLKHRTAQNYRGAINGALSTWSKENGLADQPLTSITDHVRFKAIASKIRLLPVFAEHDQRGNSMYGNALSRYYEYLCEQDENAIEHDIDALLDNATLSRTERHDLVKSRIGQGVFREGLLAIWKACAVTGYSDTRLLLASHIKPWRASTNAERLDPFNGLLLSPNLDRAFDTGLITFAVGGAIILSPQLIGPDKLGITPSMRVKLTDRHEPFMNYHRKNVYRVE